MTSVPDAPAAPRLTVEASEAMGARLGDGPRVRELRTIGATAMTVLPMPTTVERPWKYLDVTGLDLSSYEPRAVRPTGRVEREQYGIEDGNAGVLIQVDGVTATAESAADGLLIEDFADAPADKLELLGTAVSPDVDRFAALHYAFLQGGVVVHAAADAEIAAPVRIVRDYASEGQFATPHTLIVSGANSRLTVVEELRSGPGDIVAAPVVEILPGPGSVVRYIVIHRWGAETRVYGRQRAVTDNASEFMNLHVVTSGNVVKYQVESSLEGRGSASELLSVTVGTGTQHIDFNSLQDHIAPDTRSDLLFKSALQDSSRSVYYGVTRVGLGARNADANQEDRNLLLSKNARADSDPVLEILTNDVIRCAHGATAGPVDEEQLFYIQSRGLDRRASVALLVRGFLDEVLERASLSDELHGYLTELLEDRLESA